MEVEVKTKICRRCKKSFDATLENFYVDRRTKDGFNKWCKSCCSDYNNERYGRVKTNPEEYERLVEKLIMQEQARGKSRDRIAIGPEKLPIGNEYRGGVNPPPPPVRQISQEKFVPSPYGSGNNTSLAKGFKFYQDAFVNGYGNLAGLGLSDTTIRRLFGVESYSVFKSHSVLDEEADERYRYEMECLQKRLAHLMLIQAQGYSYEEERIEYKKKNGRWVEFNKKKFKKWHPGNGYMLITYLANRFPEDWKISKEVVHKEAAYDTDRKKIESLARDVFAADTPESEGEPGVQG